MRSVLLFLVLASVICGGGFLLAEEVLPGASTFPVRDLPALLPDTCALRITLDGGPCVRGGDGLALAALLADPEVKAFTGPLAAALRGSLGTFETEVKEYLGLTMDEALQLLRYRLTAAFCGFVVPEGGQPAGAPTPNAVLTLEFENEIEMVQRLMYALEEAVLAWGDGRFTDDTVAGLPVRRYIPDPKKPGTPTAWYLLDDRMLLLATDRPTLEGIVKRIKSGAEEGSLAASERFKSVRERVSGPGAIVSVYADIPQLMGQIGPAMGGQDMLEMVALAGLDAVKSVGYGLSVDGSGLRDRLFVQVDDGPLREALESTAPLKAHQLVPHTAGIYGSGLLDLAAMWQRIHGIVSESDPDTARDMEEGLAAFGDMIGADPVADVMAQLGPEYAVAGWWSGQALIPDVGLFIEVRDRDAFAKVLDRTLAALDVPISSFEHRGYTAGVMELGRLGGVRLGVPQRLTWVFLDDYLVVTLWPQAAKNLIDHVEGGGASLAEAPAFKAMLGHLRADNPKAATAGIGWFDVEGLVAFLCDNGVPIAQSFLPSNDMVPVEWALFPQTETITQHLSGMIGGSQWTADGYYTEYRSPTGYLGPYMLSVGLVGLVAVREQEAARATLDWEARQRLQQRGAIPFDDVPVLKVKPKKLEKKKPGGEKKNGGGK